ncbi:hypothetical protein HYW76_05685 [Candidatus Pacearchaeota archaeon]|nr:hypothetical protein [Candidatus Pacearchaeota archaeon]
MGIIKSNSIEDAKKQIEKAYKEKQEVIIEGRDISYNRIMLENKKLNALILNHKNKRDKLKQRDSGLNQVLCKIARENNITFTIDINELKTENKKEKAEILSRIIQNIKLINKFKNKLKIINYQDKYNAKSLLATLGLPTNLAKSAVEE